MDSLGLIKGSKSGKIDSKPLVVSKDEGKLNDDDVDDDDSEYTATNDNTTLFIDSSSTAPSSKHISLSESSLQSKLLIIGDIHGCLEELKLLLTKANYHPSSMTVVLVGDLVNKGPYSAEVIKYVKDSNFYCVLGI
jgi:Calcineurin-like phosphoesterase